MQAIVAVPMFEGASSDLEFFLRRMDLIVQQVKLNPLDEATNKYVLGYFYSRMSLQVLQDIGASCDTSWEDIKTLLRERYGGAGRSIPKLIIREVFLTRDNGESVTNYAKAILKGVRKVRSRMTDATDNKEEAEIRIQLLEELATEVLTQNLPRRVKQWVRIVKPTSIEALVKTVEDEEAEEREERWEESKRKSGVGRGFNNERKTGYRGDWQKVEQRRRDYRTSPRAQQHQQQQTNSYSRKEKEYKTYFGKGRAAWKPQEGRRLECWECREPGHFARECPYIFRREKTRQVSYRRDEPMEINVTRRTGYRSGSDSESDSSTSSSMSSESKGSKRKNSEDKGIRGEDWPALPPREGGKTRWNKAKGE